MLTNGHQYVNGLNAAWAILEGNPQSSFIHPHGEQQLGTLGPFKNISTLTYIQNGDNQISLKLVL